MKTKAFTYLKLVLLTTLMVNLTSCEVALDDFYDDDNIGGGYYNKSRDLCSRTWVDMYFDADGNRCWQELDFYLDRTGVEYIRIEYRNGGVYQNSFNFRWSWENYGQTSLRMLYGPGDASFLDDVQIRNNTLSGYLDGWDNYVDYTGRR